MSVKVDDGRRHLGQEGRGQPQESVPSVGSFRKVLKMLGVSHRRLLPYTVLQQK